MYRARKIIEIIENFYSGYKGRHGEYTEVFVNPDRREIMDSTKNPEKSVRFVADLKTKKVFIWDAFSALHPEIMPKINPQWNWRDPYLFLGTAVATGGKLVLDSIDRLEFMRPEDIKTLFSQDWGWVDRYVLVSPRVERDRRYYNRQEG